MKLPGGLGKKWEDWLEHQHQEGHEIRTQYRTTKDQAVRANAIAGATQRDFNPKVKAKIQLVKSKAEHGPRKDYVTREKERRLERDANRLKALGEWEALNKHIVLATAVDVCQPVNIPPLTAHLPAVGDTRVYSYR